MDAPTPLSPPSSLPGVSQRLSQQGRDTDPPTGAQPSAPVPSRPPPLTSGPRRPQRLKSPQSPTGQTGPVSPCARGIPAPRSGGHALQTRSRCQEVGVPVRPRGSQPRGCGGCARGRCKPSGCWADDRPPTPGLRPAPSGWRSQPLPGAGAPRPPGCPDTSSPRSQPGQVPLQLAGRADAAPDRLLQLPQPWGAPAQGAGVGGRRRVCNNSTAPRQGRCEVPAPRQPAPLQPWPQPRAGALARRVRTL